MTPRESLIYLDHHATTPVDPRVVDVMSPWWTTWAANASSISHRAGDRAREAVEAARAEVAAELRCDAREIVFTSGATEANNLALKGVLLGRHTQQRLVTAAAEHRSILDPARRLQRQGVDVAVLSVTASGGVDREQLREAIHPGTTLVSLMWANNEVGTLNDIAGIAELCQQAGVPLHVDASQAAGKLAIRLDELPIHLLSLTAHKFHGPQGIGVLIVRRGELLRPLQPLFNGGGHEQGLRSGTLPVPLVVGMGAALTIAAEERDRDNLRIGALRDQLWNGLRQRVPEITRNSPASNGLPHNLNLRVGGVDGDVLMMRLQATRLCVSSGAACTSARSEPSHVLRAMGLSDQDARASLRFGLGRFTTAAQIADAIDIVARTVSDIRSAG